MSLLKAIEIQAKLTLLKEAIIRKNTIQDPKSKEDVFKPISKQSQEAITTLLQGHEYISKLIDMNNDLSREIEAKDKMLSNQSFEIGRLKIEVIRQKKLTKINEF